MIGDLLAVKELQTVDEHSSVSGHGVISDHQIKQWFLNFSLGDTLLRVEPTPDGASELDWNSFRESVECNPRKGLQELSLDPCTFQSIIYRYLKKKNGKVSFFILLVKVQ